MFTVLPALRKDGYKADHKSQYPTDLELVYSNGTARKSRLPGVTKIVPFSFQAYVRSTLIDDWNREFFQKDRDLVVKQYKRRLDTYLGPEAVNPKHIGELHELGYLPLLVKAIPEGLPIPLRVPAFTIRNTDKHFGWLTNMLETDMSSNTWPGINSATIAHQYRKRFDRGALETGAALEFCQWQGHDFSYRGMMGLYAAALSGAAHLLSFTGTDTIPAIDFLEQFYGADAEKELIGGSVPATEHSVMCVGGKNNVKGLVRRLITEVYPKGIVSIVWDTWDYWGDLLTIIPALKSEILAREGKLVIRPDSGDPADIICGRTRTYGGELGPNAGTVESLGKLVGQTKNAAGYLELDPHIGCIYGDSITLERQDDMLNRLKLKGYASSAVGVLGIGSYTYQFVTRDTLGQAMKATYDETTSRGGEAIFKDPKTDDGTKKSATGLLCVDYDENGEIILKENCTWEEESKGLLQPIFCNGKQLGFQTLSEIRARLEAARKKELA